MFEDHGEEVFRSEVRGRSEPEILMPEMKETGAPAKGKGKSTSVKRKQGECYQWKAKGQCTKGDACSFRHDENTRGKTTRSSTLAPEPQTRSDEEKYSKGKSLRGRSPSGKRSRRSCKDHSGKCTNPSCRSWETLICQCCKTESGRKFGEKFFFMHTEADSQHNDRIVNSGKSYVDVWKNSGQSSCTFQDIELPKSKGTKILGT